MSLLLPHVASVLLNFTLFSFSSAKFSPRVLTFDLLSFPFLSFHPSSTTYPQDHHLPSSYLLFPLCHVLPLVPLYFHSSAFFLCSLCHLFDLTTSPSLPPFISSLYHSFSCHPILFSSLPSASSYLVLSSLLSPLLAPLSPFFLTCCLPSHLFHSPQSSPPALDPFIPSFLYLPLFPSCSSLFIPLFLPFSPFVFLAHLHSPLHLLILPSFLLSI